MKRAPSALAAAVLAAALVAASPAPPPEPDLTGFSPSRASWQRDYEKRFLALPRAEDCGKTLRELTRTPHLAGTPGNERVADWLAEEYRKAGFEVSMPSYDVLLSYPKSARLEIVGEPGVELGRGEPPIDSDPDTNVPEAAIAWNAYAPSADVVGEVVYVNRGSAEDYEALARMGVDVRGKIALARYFGGYRGGKSLEAEKRGVLAILVYSDPYDDGWYQGPVYPDGPWGPTTHFQRGANVYDFIAPGDPLTPGWASTKDARRIPEGESEILPKIPMMPLPARDAAEILRRIGGKAVPGPGWQGLAISETMRVGPGPVRLRMRIEYTRERRTIRNVIARLRGTDEPARQVLLSNHYDAWIYGAVDPSSGTATMLEIGRALGRLASEGLRPRRTITIAAWDAEEYTLTGSTEWGEENEADLKRHAVVCINVDEATHGPHFSPSASPLLFSAIREAARDVPDPARPERTLADAWREDAGFIGVMSYATAAGARQELPVAVLGSGSDYTVFFNRLGVPSTDLVFDGPYGVYHSVYDTYRWMAEQGDPGFRYHAGMARYAGVLALRFANADILPLDAAAYGREIAGYAEELAASPAGAPLAAELGALAAKARNWSSASAAAQASVLARIRTGASMRQLADANGWLMSLERAMLDGPGIPGRPWFRHLVYAPLPSYKAETLPAVREAAVAGNVESARLQVQRLGEKLDAATAAARSLAPDARPMKESSPIPLRKGPRPAPTKPAS
jgi:N-acetylated-alpha-linked acidic dipeptidase